MYNVHVCICVCIYVYMCFKHNMYACVWVFVEIPTHTYMCEFANDMKHRIYVYTCIQLN